MGLVIFAADKHNETAQWSEEKAKTTKEITSYQYLKAKTLLQDYKNKVKDQEISKEISGFIEDIEDEHSLFSNMVKKLTGGPARRKISIDNRDVFITNADEIFFEGAFAGVSGSYIKRRWQDLPQDIVLGLFPKDITKSERFSLATFCYHHNLEREGERNLLFCLRSYPELKDRIDRFLARYKDIPLPEGGFFEYQAQLVTAEEKTYLEKGYVKYQGKWISYDEMMAQRGFIKFQDKWVTAEEKKKIEERLNALKTLEKRLGPKGVIDNPGADKEKLAWEDARVKEIEHYVIKANLSQEALNDLCYLMECLYFEMSKIFKLAAQTSGKKLTVYVFKEASEYYANGGPRGSHGIYMSDGVNKQIMTFYQPPGTTFVLLHEGTHQFVDLVCKTKVPIWINEGLATYYESSKFEGASLKTNIVNQNRLQLIRKMIIKKDVMRLEDLINIRQINFSIYEYAHSWSVVYFFMNYQNGTYADELEAYFEQIKKKGFENRPLHKQLFEDAFKVRFEVLEKQWEEYILKQVK